MSGWTRITERTVKSSSLGATLRPGPAPVGSPSKTAF